MFCCDAYNAMTTDRVYRAALSVEAAIAELRANAGTQFDPIVVDALLSRVGSRCLRCGAARAPARGPRAGRVSESGRGLNRL